MEYIDGFGIHEKERLLEEGYDLKEIGTKLVDNYIKQVMDDGFSMRIHIRVMCGYGMGKLSGLTWG